MNTSYESYLFLTYSCGKMQQIFVYFIPMIFNIGMESRAAYFRIFLTVFTEHDIRTPKENGT